MSSPHPQETCFLMLGELGDLLSHLFSLVVVNLDGILLREVDVLDARWGSCQSRRCQS